MAVLNLNILNCIISGETANAVTKFVIICDNSENDPIMPSPILKYPLKMGKITKVPDYCV